MWLFIWRSWNTLFAYAILLVFLNHWDVWNQQNKIHFQYKNVHINRSSMTSWSFAHAVYMYTHSFRENPIRLLFAMTNSPIKITGAVQISYISLSTIFDRCKDAFSPITFRANRIRFKSVTLYKYCIHYPHSYRPIYGHISPLLSLMQIYLCQMCDMISSSITNLDTLYMEKVKVQGYSLIKNMFHP